MSLYEKLKEIAGNDVVEIFGPSGSGKTSFCLALAVDAVKSGKSVYFVDAERNVSSVPEGIKYVYDPTLDGILNYVRYAPRADLLILDSLGFPVVAKYAEASMNERGSMLLKSVTITSYLKIWTWRNNSLAVVTNQPVSSFGKDVPEEELKPFGDKSIYGFKSIWRTYLVKASEEETVCEIRVWRDRKFGRGKKLFNVTISDRGINVESLI